MNFSGLEFQLDWCLIERKTNESKITYNACEISYVIHIHQIYSIATYNIV